MTRCATVRRAFAAGTAACGLLLSGCAALLPPAKPAAPRVQAVPVYQSSLTLEGRIAVRYRQEAREESLQGSFRWRQLPERTTVTLLSPLNQTLATLDVTPDAAQLTEAGKPPRIAADIDTLSRETLGWTLPVAGLRGWLQGFSLASGRPRPIAEPGAEDAPPVTTPDGWQLRYVSWQDEDAPPLTRPKRIDLQRTTPELGEMHIRIVIDRWQQP